MTFLVRAPHSHIRPFTSTRPPPPKAASCSSSTTGNNELALLWFKHDLRLDDHPALVSSASHYHSLLPLYIFDHRIISRFSDETLEIALSALQELRSSLQDKGSNLMVKFGGAEDVIVKLVNDIVLECDKFGLNEVKSVDVFAEEEVEYDLRRMIASVDTCLSNASLSQGRTKLVLWRTPFYDIQSLNMLPAIYSDFEKLKLSPTSPLASPVLPHLDFNMDWGSIPTFDEVKRYYTSVNSNTLNKRWASVKRASVKSVRNIGKFNVGEDSHKSNPVGGSRVSITKAGKLRNSVFISREANVVGGGTSVVLNALAAYLRYLEGTSRDDWQEVHIKLRNAESRSGASFGAMFRPALSLGLLSRRRVYYEAIKYEKERNSGFLSPFGYSAATVAAAADTVTSMEWYWLMALKSQIDKGRRHPVHLWRWKEFLIEYAVLGLEGPAILLVHGFGAFLEHYRDNITPLADAGNRVWAVTILGFGKSEKPNVVYTEIMWAEMLRDFIEDVVGGPVHVVGNSIGGYFAAIVAGLWPALVKSIVLINTAGSVIMGDPPVLVSEVRHPDSVRQISRAAWLGSRLLLLYLRIKVGDLVRNCYPTNRERADDWLINEMLRASHDPGVLLVLESVFSFNLSIPLNYLFESFGGNVLLIQGMKDPLMNSESRLSMFREHCKGVDIKELDAGHCPHDECAEEVNCLIREWVVNTERSFQTC